MLEAISTSVAISQGLQTQRYGKLVLPEISICGVRLMNMEVKVARFEEEWGIDALIGLDFFRLYPVSIDFSRAVIEVG